MHVVKEATSTVALLGMVVCGCSGGSESRQFSVLSQQQTAEGEGPAPDFKKFRTDFSDYELPERTIACPTDDSDHEVSTAKLFYPAVIDAEIARFPALLDAVGSDRVETCEQALLWSSARMAIVEGEIPSAELPPPERDHDTPPIVEKIWQGLNTSDDSQPGFWYTGSSAFDYCSAVAITPNHLLTAAHCVPANTQMCTAPGETPYPCHRNTIDVYEATASGGKLLYGTFVVFSYRFEGFGGGVDPANDLALIEMPGTWGMWQSGLRRIEISIPSYDYFVGGWGRKWATGPDSTAEHGVLRKPFGDGWFHADMMSSTYMYDRGDGDVQMCNGDSGGPAFSTIGGNIGGIHTSSEKSDASHFCSTESTQKKRWTRPGDKILWIEERLRLSPFYTCPVSSAQFCCSRASNYAQCY